MDNENNTQTSVPLQTKPASPAGALIGSIIIILILILGGFYLWSANIGPKIQKDSTAELNAEEQQLDASEAKLAEPDAKINELQTQGATDDVDSIEQDLNAVQLDDMDNDLQGM